MTDTLIIKNHWIYTERINQKYQQNNIPFQLSESNIKATEKYLETELSLHKKKNLYNDTVSWNSSKGWICLYKENFSLQRK